MIDTQKENEFYSKDFDFSYSSLNKLLFCPSLFYKDYILKDKEVRTDKHLIEGSLLHCLLFEPENVLNKFNIVPGKTPTDNIRKVMKDMSLYTSETDFNNIKDSVILDSLKNMNLYQSLKTDEQRLAKIKVSDYKPYWTFINNTNVNVVDQETLDKSKKRVEILMANEEVKDLLQMVEKDFELDPVETYCEKKLRADLKNYTFGLKGIVDYYKIDSEEKTITICDLKTTGKTLSEFGETVNFYNYWLQAAVYCHLVINNVEDDYKDYNILFKFVVIDKYDQVYVFDVSEKTLSNWAVQFSDILERADYHYTKKKYNLPFDFLTGQVFL